MAANKAHLVPVQKLVIRHGQQFMTTVYVNPNKVNKVDHTKHVVVPDWKLTNAQELEDEKNKIVKTKDPAEKEALKDEFLKHLKSMGVTWTDNSNDAINFMRALMAAKDHLNTNGNSIPNPAPTPQPQANPTTQAPTPTVGGQTMSKDDAKKVIKDMQKKESVENIMARMKSQGLSWNDHANPAVNKMRAMMVLNSHLQSGGTLGGSAQPAPAPTSPAAPSAPVTVQAKKPTPAPAPTPAPNAPTAGTVEADYHTATPKSKVIGILTGMVPKDSDAEAFLARLIKEGKIEVDPSAISSSGSGDDYGLPKGMLQALSRHGRVNDYIKNDDFNSYNRPDYAAEEVFKDKGKAEYAAYKKSYEDYKSKYGQDIMNDHVQFIKGINDGIELMDSVGMTVNQTKTGQDYHNDLVKLLNNGAATAADADMLWDRLKMDDFLDRRTLYPRSGDTDNPPMQTMVEFAFGGGKENLDHVKDVFMQKFAMRSSQPMSDILNEVRNGTQTKQAVFQHLQEAISNPVTLGRMSLLQNNNRDNMWRLPLVPLMMDQSKLGYWDHDNLPRAEKYFKKLYDSQHHKLGGATTPKYDKAEFKNFIFDAIIDKEGLVSPEAKWVKNNLILYNVMRASSSDSYYGKFKMPENYEPVDFNDWQNSPDKLDVFKRHFAIMRKATTTRDKWRKKLTPQQNAAAPKSLDKQALYEAIKKDGDLSQLHIPEHNDVKGMLKCAVEKSSDKEKETAQKKINESHDTTGHSSFRTKVNNVFRITNLPYEEKFQQIDKDRNNTGFYYHGTDYRAMQLILGKSGQFVVTKTNQKAGRMLGDGVYLAKQSSKSMQYISSGFNRGIGNKGVLFLCKASLGKAVESFVHGASHNTPILAKKDVDTVYMLKPHVVNPEWAVKEEKAVIPRLIIDVEMVNP